MRRWRWTALCWTCLAISACAAEGPALPGFRELEAAGAVIGEVRIQTDNIFDLADPKEDNPLFRLANAIHIKTRPGVIRRALLFKTGDKVSARQIEETERLLRQNGLLYDVRIRPVAVHDGVVDVEVRTRDTWSLEPGVSFSRTGGANSSGVTLRDKNFLGTGVTLGYAHVSNPDRSGRELEFSDHELFGDRSSLDFTRADYSDGSAHSFSLAHPFYALETPWAAGVSAGSFSQIDSLYSGGAPVAQFRQEQRTGQVFGGVSSGLKQGWVQRYSAGLGYEQDRYALEPGLPAPAQLPADQTLAYPFVRYELIQDHTVTVRNHDVIGRPEYFDLGLHASVQLGRSSAALGATRSPWLYSAAVGKGIETRGGGQALGALSLSGEYEDGSAKRQFYSSTLRYYLPHSPRRLFYAYAELDAVVRPGPADQLLLGGDSGLPGYPTRYQSGTHRALFTLEERFYTDIYLYRLLRVGAAAFVDAGRAWGGAFADPANYGLLRDAGFGLRLVSDRSASANVVHLDIAFPLDTQGNVRKAQFLVKTYASF